MKAGSAPLASGRPQAAHSDGTQMLQRASLGLLAQRSHKTRKARAAVPIRHREAGPGAGGERAMCMAWTAHYVYGAGCALLEEYARVQQRQGGSRLVSV